MKIISASRSDVFNEYVNIISKYNDKKTAYDSLQKSAFRKESSTQGEIIGDLTNEALHAGAKASDEVLQAATVSGAKITAEEFSKAGIHSLTIFNAIWGNVKEISKTFGNDEIKFVIRKADGVWELPDASQIAAAKSWAQKQGGGTSFIQTAAFPDGSVIGIKNITKDQVFDAAKLLTDNTPFNSTGEIIEFGNLSKKVLAEADPSIARVVPPPGGTIPATGDWSKFDQVAALGRKTDKDFAGVGRGISKTIGEVREAKKVLLESISNLRKELTDAIEAGNEGVIEKLFEKIELSQKEITELVKQEIKTLSETTQTSLTELTTKLETAIEKNNTTIIDSVKTEIKNLQTKFVGDFEEITKSISNLNTTIEKNAADSLQANEAMKKMLAEQSDQLKKQSDLLEELKKQIADLHKNTGAAGGALGTATEAGASAVTKVGYWKTAGRYLKSALQIAAALGVGYLAYKWYTGSGIGVPGEGSGRVGGAIGNEPTIVGGESSGGGDSLSYGVDPGLRSSLDDPNERRALFDSLDGLDPAEREALLQKIARYYGASGYIKLKSPVTISGESIRYVFPVAFRGGRDPIKDVARRAVSEDYFVKVYSEDTLNNRRIISRFETGAQSPDAQRIANYGFSVVAGGGLFSGKGTFMGNRGSRYGRGKENVGVSDFGMSGTSQRKMTREERRAVQNRSGISEANDYLTDNIDDPMDAFAAGRKEYLTKISKNIDNSTNKTNSYEFAKKADKISNRYFKDAVKDLQDDEFMKAYYAGFSKLHNQKPKKQKPDYEKLYDVHDETGAELIHKAHPKAISVADAIGNGGLVENESEKSKAMEDIAFRVPSGNYRARYAFIQNALNKKS